MQETYLNFLNLVNLYRGPEDLSEAAELYQVTEDPVVLAYVFVKLYPLILLQVGKFFYLTDEDKASFAVEELHRTMLDYRHERGAQLHTLYVRYLNNRLRSETYMLNHHRRKANYLAVSYDEAIRDEASDDLRFDRVDLEVSISSSLLLSEREIKYCRIFLREEGRVEDKEIAKELGVTPTAVHYLKQRLAVKLPKILLAD